MKRETVVGLLICLMGGAIVFIGLSSWFFPTLTFHYERHLSQGDVGRFDLDVTGFENCWLEISVRDDPELLYEVDIELYNRGVDESDFEVIYDEINNQRTLSVEADEDLHFTRKIVVAVGNSLPLSIHVLGRNLTSSIILGNNAIFDDDSTFGYCGNGDSFGSLTLQVDESLNIDGDVRPYVWDVKTVNLAVNLPEDVNGYLTYDSVESIQASTDGWYYSELPGDYTYYSTLSTEVPRLFFSIRRVNTLNADLSV